MKSELWREESGCPLLPPLGSRWWPESLPRTGMRDVVLTPPVTCHGNLTQPCWSKRQTPWPLIGRSCFVYSSDFKY
ncbi:rCG56218 [Rattus norvegicus]|uniref:RCG56218 n=1 Tax=Rattus norvegicus TaxID=10116 RepID=A6IB14_RAT|nr:rCG56218 [Rattus norvegicus]